MATLKQYPPLFCFSSDITDVIFSTDDENGILQLDIVHGTERETLLEETMFPSLDGSIVISDLSSLVEPYARQYHFLTILSGEKITARGREERLYAYGADTVTVIADVQLETGQFNTLSAELTPFEHVNGTGIYSYDVSPENVASLIGLVGGRLLGYRVEAGNRCQRFRCTVALLRQLVRLL